MTLPTCKTADCDNLVRQFRHCYVCREKRNRERRAVYAQRKADGKCIDCGIPLDGSSWTRCNEHRLDHGFSQYARIARRLADGKCKQCGERPPAEGGVACEDCRAKNRIYERSRTRPKRTKKK